jgi:hypothetical protein
LFCISGAVDHLGHAEADTPLPAPGLNGARLSLIYGQILYFHDKMT